MYLFFDTETSGLPRYYNAPESDTRNWPRLVQLAWVTGDSLTTVSAPQVYLIKPDEFTIDSRASAVHGITTAMANATGVALTPVLDSFVQAVNNSTVVVAHNIEFDTNIVGAECAREGIANPIRRRLMRCTMKEATDYCRIPSQRGFKWPTLTELHWKLFQSGLADAHDASIDCQACMKCFFRLQELNVI